MAQTQVVITAVDRTKAAAESVVRGMKSIERSAKLTAKVTNAAFALISGAVVTNAFNKIADATAKTTEGAARFAGELKRVRDGFGQLAAARSGVPAATDALIKLNETLRDPQVVAAADAITSTLVTGFAKAATSALQLAQGIRQALVIAGVTTAKTPEEQIAVLRRELAGLQGAPNVMQPGAGKREFAMPGLPGDPQRIQQIKDEIAALELLQLTEVKIESRRVKTPKDDMKAYYDKVLPEVVIKSTKKVLSETEQLIQGYREKLRTAAQIEAAEIANIEAMALGIGMSREDTDRLLSERFLTGVEVTGKKVQEVTTQMDEFAKAAAQNMQSAFADFLFDPFQNGLRGMLKGFIDTIRRMVAELMASYLLRQFFQYLSGFGGPIGTVATALSSGLQKRAMGGPVTSNTPYMVGERGPELFVPGSSGTIVPNHAMGGVTVSPVYNIDARGATADLQKALPGILNENNRRIFDELDRRYGIGR